MPNFDGGHYFLTMLAPIREGNLPDPVVGASRSHRQVLAQKLALLPLGRQIQAAPAGVPASPFARNSLNHLARFVIINGPAFNGRNGCDTLVAAATNINPLVPQPVDRLNRAYLLFAADIDAPQGEDGALRAYCDALWDTMAEDLKGIFRHCMGFEKVDGKDAFYAYVTRCQVETTMPFNDYWAHGMQLPASDLPITGLKWSAIAAVVAVGIWALLLVVNGVFTLLGFDSHLAASVGGFAAWASIIATGLILIASLAAYGVYRSILNKGRKPFKTAPGSDLPTVLKALFLQQHFTRFAIETQGLDGAALQESFVAFLNTVQPSAAEPRQVPGEIASPKVEWL